MSGILKLPTTAGGSVSLQVDDTLITDEVVEIPSGGFKGNNIAGVMFDFGGVTAPTGSVACLGQELSKTTYAALYAAIGDLWSTTGGVAAPSSGNFRVPPSSLDGLGVFTRGKSATTSVGDSQANQNKSHTHTGPSHTHTGPSHTHTMNHDHPNVTTSAAGAHNHSVSGTNGTRAVNRYISGASTVSVGLASTRTTSTKAAHTHTLNVPNYSGSTGSGGTGNTGASGTGNTGSEGGTEARPHNITVLKCIWTGV